MKVGKISDIRIGLPLARKKGDIHDDQFFRYKAVTLKAFSSTGQLLHDELDEFIASEELSESYITQEGDILVRLREPNTAVYIDKESSGLLVPALMAIIKPKKEINSRYLTHYINSNEAQKRLHKELQGTTIQMLKASELADLDVTLPPEETQEEIVAMLNLANREIELLDTLKSLKTQFKNELLDTILKKEINQ
ncbi:MAG: restriction endonuclease subunit S [Campylobacterota bacterium]